MACTHDFELLMFPKNRDVYNDNRNTSFVHHQSSRHSAATVHELQLGNRRSDGRTYGLSTSFSAFGFSICGDSIQFLFQVDLIQALLLLMQKWHFLWRRIVKKLHIEKHTAYRLHEWCIMYLAPPPHIMVHITSLGVPSSYIWK